MLHQPRQTVNHAGRAQTANLIGGHWTMDFTGRVRMPMKDPIDTWREDNGKSILFPTGADAAGGHCFVAGGTNL
jgi:hypothetical protein